MLINYMSHNALIVRLSSWWGSDQNKFFQNYIRLYFTSSTWVTSGNFCKHAVSMLCVAVGGIKTTHTHISNAYKIPLPNKRTVVLCWKLHSFALATGKLKVDMQIMQIITPLLWQNLTLFKLPTNYQNIFTQPESISLDNWNIQTWFAHKVNGFLTNWKTNITPPSSQPGTRSSPCWLPWHSNPGPRERWSPVPTGSGCQSEATPPPLCRSEIHPGTSASVGPRIIHSGHISSAGRRRPTPAPCSRSRSAPTRRAWPCWGLWPRRWGRRWSSCAGRRAPWYGTLRSGTRGYPCNRGPAAGYTGHRPAGRYSNPHLGAFPPAGHQRATWRPRSLRCSAGFDTAGSELENQGDEIDQMGILTEGLQPIIKQKHKIVLGK